jgi:hypothetical protein
MFGSLFPSFQKCGPVFPNGSRVVVAQGCSNQAKTVEKSARKDLHSVLLASSNLKLPLDATGHTEANLHGSDSSNCRGRKD